MCQTRSPASSAAVECIAQSVVLGEHGDVLVSEGHHRLPGEGSEIDNRVDAEAAGVVEAVCKDEAPFSIGVVNLDPLAGVHVQDVAEFVGVSADQVLNCTDDAVNLDVWGEVADNAHSTNNGGRAGHVTAHGLHTGAGLHGVPSGIEGDALADQSNLPRGRALWRVLHVDEARLAL